MLKSDGLRIFLGLNAPFYISKYFASIGIHVFTSASKIPCVEQTVRVWLVEFEESRSSTTWVTGIGLSLRAVPLVGCASHLLYDNTGDLIVFSCTCTWLFRVPSFALPSSITCVTWCVTCSRLGRFFLATFLRCSMHRTLDSPSIAICRKIHSRFRRSLKFMSQCEK